MIKTQCLTKSEYNEIRTTTLICLWNVKFFATHDKNIWIEIIFKEGSTKNIQCISNFISVHNFSLYQTYLLVHTLVSSSLKHKFSQVHDCIIRLTKRFEKQSLFWLNGVILYQYGFISFYQFTQFSISL